MFSMSIPQISDEEVMKRYEQIKPVITVNGKLYHFREFSLEEIRNNGYLWNRAKDIREEVTPDELEVIPGQDFICLHTYALTTVYLSLLFVKFFLKLKNLIFLLSEHSKLLIALRQQTTFSKMVSCLSH